MFADLLKFTAGSIRIVAKGNRWYAIWITALVLLMIQGGFAYWDQLKSGLIVSNMRDQVSWGFYIGNFTFLVGLAAAAIMLVVPAYIYNWEPIKKIVVFGELLAIAAIIMSLFFVLVDIGRPERFWHLLPYLGVMNFPSSMMAWDAVVLNLYLVVNLVVATHLLLSWFMRREHNERLVNWLVISAIPLAIGLSTIEAFLYNGMPGRPYWNSAILAPRFIVSAFCSGPAILLILLQILRRTTKFQISDAAIDKIAELMAYAMFVNLFLLGAEVFKEYYSDTEHLLHTEYLYFGLHGAPSPIAPYAWMSVIFGIVAFLLFLVPTTRRNVVTMNIGCLLIYASVYIEKGVALIIPGYTPDQLGLIYHYFPSSTEIRVAAGIFSLGFLVFTLMVKVAIAIMFEEYTVDDIRPRKSIPARA